METPMTRIEYSKEFLTGLLAGLTVRGGFNVPSDVAAARMAELNRFTKLNPGRDCVTGDQFWIYNLGSVGVDTRKERL
jgi:hypothetical protein